MPDKNNTRRKYQYLWRFINYLYGAAVLGFIIYSIQALLLMNPRFRDDSINKSALLAILAVFILIIIFRNLAKPFFIKKINKS